jgi:HAD superfamily hydrolase (TIGR01450 family)
MIVQGLILDMDGVIWRDRQPIGDLPHIFKEINRLGLRVTLATNNATLSAEKFQEKLAGFGVELESWQIVSSAQATAEYLAQRYPNGGPVFIVGEEGLVSSLAKYGFYQSDQSPLAVIAGLDRQLTYQKLCQAALFVRSGVLFIGTNPDRTLPTPEGFVPGAGSILAALEVASDVKPLLIGKPAPEMYRVALRRLQTIPENTLVVGDRLETDIAGAQELRCQTALVLSGATTLEAARQWQPAPDYICEDLEQVLKRIS